MQLRRDRPGAASVGGKVMALSYAMVLGADSIDDADVLRAGRLGRLLGGWVPAPSTLGTFLRAFTFGHVRRLDKLLARSGRDRRRPQTTTRGLRGTQEAADRRSHRQTARDADAPEAAGSVLRHPAARSVVPGLARIHRSGSSHDVIGAAAW